MVKRNITKALKHKQKLEQLYKKGGFSETILNEKDLSGANLQGINLSGSNLRGKNLRNADLTGADLSETDLTGAHLSGANLTEANLSKAILKFTDLSGANLSGTNLEGTYFHRPNVRGINLSRTNLAGRNFRGINLSDAILIRVNLSGAILSEAVFSKADLRNAELNNADLSGANFSGANLSEADLSGANLINSIFVGTNLRDALLTDCWIYGISVWDVQMEGAIQFDLAITLPDQPTITVDNLKVAQFIYLLLNNSEIRDVIDTITSKVVLILGRFTPDRKIVLDTLREELRKKNYLPVLFDFDKPASQNTTETVLTLAHLARFIIVDLTDPSSAPYEVANIVPQCIVPIQPLLLQDDAKPRREFSMFIDLRTSYHWVLPTHRYRDTSSLLAALQEEVIEPAERKAEQLRKMKNIIP
jgi:uncharacterized protein YjbI with pentapeptide repeats